MEGSAKATWAKVALATLVFCVTSLAKADGSRPQELGGGAGTFGTGSGSVDAANGAAVVSYPFILPDARGGAHVQLGLSYRSDRGDSDAGKGWGLDMPTIERHRGSNLPVLNQAQDEYLPHPRFPSLYDEYSWNGQPLVEICTIINGACDVGDDQSFRPGGAGTDGWRYYRLRRESEGSFIRFFHKSDGLLADYGWQVEYKDGVIEEYGTSANSADLTSPTRQGDQRPTAGNGSEAVPVRWNISRRIDSHVDGGGKPVNIVWFDWTRPHAYARAVLSDIWYTPLATGNGVSEDTKETAHHVRLVWAPHDFAFRYFAPMDKAVPSVRLAGVDVTSRGNTGAPSTTRSLIRRYRLSYFQQGVDAPQWNHSFLKSIELEGASAVTEAGPVDQTVPLVTNGPRLPPTTFAYTELSKRTIFGMQLVDAVDRIPGSNSYGDPWRSTITDLNRDGLPDYLSIAHWNEEDHGVPDHWESQAFLQTGAPPIPNGTGLAYREECVQIPSPALGNLFSADSITLGGKWGFDNPTGFVFSELGALPYYSVGFRVTRPVQVSANHQLCTPEMSAGASRPGWSFQAVGNAFQPGDPGYQPMTCPSIIAFPPTLPGCWFFRQPVDVDGDGLTDMYAHFDQPQANNSDWYNPTNVDKRKQQMLFSYRSGGSIVPLNERVRTNISVRPKRATVQFADVNGDGILDYVTNTQPRDEQDGHISSSSLSYIPGYGDGTFEVQGRFGIPSDDYLDLDQWTAFHVGPTTENAQVTRGEHNIKAVPMQSAGASGWSSVGYGPQSPYPSATAMDRFPLLADLNGDGLADAVLPIDFLDGNGTKHVRLSIWLNRDGEEFIHYCPLGQPCAVDSGPEIMLASGHPRYRVAFADMDASGTTDVVIITEGHGPIWWGIVGPWVAQGDDRDVVQPKVPAGLLRHMDNGVGLQTNYTYETLQHLDRSTWTHQSQAVLPVVTSIATSQSLPKVVKNTISYTYKNPAFDPWTSRLTGFEVVSALDEGRKRRTTTTYQISPCAFDSATTSCPQGTSEDDFLQAVSGRPKSVQESGFFGTGWVEISRTLYHYDNSQLYPTTAGGRRVWFAYPDIIDKYIAYQAGGAPFTISQTVVTTHGEITETIVEPVTISEPGELVRWTKTVDRFGNTTLSTAHGRILTDGSQVDTPIVTQSTYERDPGGRPWAFNIIEQSVASGGQAPERVTQATFSGTSRNLLRVDMLLQGTGALNRVHSAGGTVAPIPSGASVDGMKTVATFEYDAYGNITRAIGTPRETVDGVKSSCVEYTYDGDYRNFPTISKVFRGGCSVDPLTSEAMYDRGFGNVLYTTSPAFEHSLFTYDNFGRLTAAYGPDANAPLTLDPLAEIKHIYTDSGPNFVRAVETQTRTGAGAYARSVEEVDSRGEVIAQWQQADVAKDGSPWRLTVPVFDTIGRAIGQRNPIGTAADPSNRQGYSLAGSATLRKVTLDAFDRVIAAYDGADQVLRREYAGLTQKDYTEGHLAAAPYGMYPIINSLDGHGRLVYTGEPIDSAGNSRATLRGYSATGLLSSTSEQSSAGQNARGFYHDSFGRLVLSVDWNAADGTRHWSYAYNDASELVATSDPRGCGANFHYDTMGRLIAKDSSPCAAEHPVYTPPDLVSGDGTEAFYRYDTPEAGEPQSDYGEVLRLEGKLISVRDRGAHTRYAYDGRSRVSQVARRIVKPGAADAALGSRYTNHWFRATSSYNLADQVTRSSTGADIPELLAGGTSDVTYDYGSTGNLDSIGGSYGTLWLLNARTPEGLVSSFQYGDLANTTGQMTYDARLRVKTRTLQRAAPSLWSQAGHAFYTLPPAGATYRQTLLADDRYTYDSASNPSLIEDKRFNAEWTTGYKPATRAFTYDALFRVVGVATGYSNAGNANDTYKNPYAAEQAINDDRPAPRRTATNRVRNQTYAYDWRDNLVSSGDDVSLFWDRSTGAASLGNGQGWQLDRLNSVGTGNNQATIQYDAQGNMSEVRVKRTGTCVVGGCFQAYAYTWDEDGKLARARRWDSTTLAGLNTNGSPAWDVKYAYDAGGQRVLKTSSDDAGNTSHTLEVLSSLRLNRTAYTTGTNDYVRSAATETVYLAGVARAFSAAGLPRISNSNLHVHLLMGDHLGSTSMVIDKDTSEVVEASLHDTYGRLESDYRPARWQSFREDYKFTGKEEDAEVGLVYFGARYYSPNLSRFISPDPLTIHTTEGGPNPYAYVHGRTSTSVDPWGLDDHQNPKDPVAPGQDHNDVLSRPDPGSTPGAVAAAQRAMAWAGGQMPSQLKERAYDLARRWVAASNGNVFTGVHGNVHIPVTLTPGLNPGGYYFRADRMQAAIFKMVVDTLAVVPGGGDAVMKRFGITGEHAGTFGIPAASDDKDVSILMAHYILAMLTVGVMPASEAAGAAAPKLLPQLSESTVAEFTTSANTQVARGGVTAIGRAMQKHAARVGSVFAESSNAAEYAKQGAEFLQKVLQDPTKVVSAFEHPVHGGVVNIRLPSGAGVQFSRGGRFIGLLEPRRGP